jgi:hypothetical protein
VRFNLSRVQRGLEKLYRIDPGAEVEDFLIDADVLSQLDVARRSREQLLLSPAGDVGLFLCRSVLDNLSENDPGDGLDDGNLADFLLAVEGVSHFVYLAWRAQSDQSVTALELELQAEVDKFVTCALELGPDVETCRALYRRLFHDFEYEPDLSTDERSRYETANRAAAGYASHLDREYLRRGRVLDMFAELRRFYRSSAADKLSWSYV